MNKDKRSEEIWKRLAELDEILRLAANEYERVGRPVLEEKAALTREQNILERQK